ncbi:MAG: alpha/beta hydrolase [Alphaproteobacteria bacterium]|nr:alpha/beta hydrolase [Alphaproteobacteria bacterium]
MTTENPQKLERSGRPALAYHYSPASGKGASLPLVMFLGGFMSDMGGSKALYLEEQCRARGQAYLRFDYSGHGFSDGNFEDGTIGVWKDDALALFDFINPERAILVGSSMGGWIALLLLLARAEKIAGVVGVAAAPDFTSDHYPDKLSPEQHEIFKRDGRLEVPTPYGPDPYVFTMALYEDALHHYLLDKVSTIESPVTLIQGMKDPDVPWEVTALIQKAFKGGPVDVVLIEDGDHRLSRPEDLTIIDREVQTLSNGGAGWDDDQ